ncbi:ribonuclease H-like domain-containing protein [Tanacetum coccineum]
MYSQWRSRTLPFQPTYITGMRLATMILAKTLLGTWTQFTTKIMNCKSSLTTFGSFCERILFLTRHILLRCDSSGDLYPVTKPSTLPAAFVSTSSTTWHQRLGHPRDEHKFHADGMLSHYKARLIANGSSQQLGVNFDETFSSVVKPATIRTVLSLVVSRQWPIHQLDVKNAFFNGDLSEIVYMHQPPGFVDSRYPNHVCLLHRVLRFVPTRFNNMSAICMWIPREPHFAALKRILRYVQGTLELGLHLYASATTSLVGYTDADWAGFPSTRRFSVPACSSTERPIHRLTGCGRISVYSIFNDQSSAPSSVTFPPWDGERIDELKMAQLSIVKKASVALVVVLVAATTVSAQEFAPAPAPGRVTRAGFSAQASGVVVGTSLVLYLVTLLKN